MNTLRQAAQQALEALEDIFGKHKVDVGAINALRQALKAEQQDEPVAWMTRFNDPERGSYEKPADTHLKRDEAERQVQRHIYKRLCKLRVEPLYTHPQPAQQPLTPEKIGELWYPYAGAPPFGFARAIERAHGIGGQP